MSGDPIMTSEATSPVGEWVTSRADIQGGEPCIAGTRITVLAIQSFASAGYGYDAIRREYPGLTDEQIDAAVSYRLVSAPAVVGEELEEGWVAAAQRRVDFDAMTVIAAHLRQSPAEPYSGRQCEEHVLHARDALYSPVPSPVPDREEIVADQVTLAECPPGLFLWNGSLGFKSECGAMEPVGDNFKFFMVGNTPDAYCADTGEVFWGGTSNHKDRSRVLVRPIDARYLLARLEGK